MSIARKLQTFLRDNHIEYEVVSHPYSERAVSTAHSACIPVKNMTKGVILNDDSGYVMAIMPSRNKLMLPWLNSRIDRQLHLTTEAQLNALFPDCEQGAVPAIGTAYGLYSCWDDELNSLQDLYVEAGNHRELIRLAKAQFKKLLQGQPHAAISCDPEETEAYKN
ncbi:aminoacyl-tRNA deacylase [Candidatus Sororendozoicomonas aggregata]|uniref:aminoacyl-tRNA deacylase n=1 Tax=Candidatus Sororendozoicomonas aggregata TaxID=3073239 RepID=UPI002ED0748A